MNSLKNLIPTLKILKQKIYKWLVTVFIIFVVLLLYLLPDFITFKWMLLSPSLCSIFDFLCFILVFAFFIKLFCFDKRFSFSFSIYFFLSFFPYSFSSFHEVSHWLDQMLLICAPFMFMMRKLWSWFSLDYKGTLIFVFVKLFLLCIYFTF